MNGYLNRISELFKATNSRIWVWNGILVLKLVFLTEFSFFLSVYRSSANWANCISLKPFLKAMCMEEVIMIVGQRSDIALTFFELFHTNDTILRSFFKQIWSELPIHTCINDPLDKLTSLISPSFRSATIIVL